MPTVDRAKATVLVKVAFVEREPRALPGHACAKVAFLKQKPADGDRKPVTAVHKEALIERDGKPVVFVYDGKLAKLTTVSKGRDLGDSIGSVA